MSRNTSRPTVYDLHHDSSSIGDGSSTEGSESLPLLKYQDEPFEIPAHEYLPPRPYYMENNNNFFHPEYTASSLVAHQADPHHHHHHHHNHQHLHHHLQHHGIRDSSTVEGAVVDRVADKRQQEMMNVLDSFLLPRDFKDKKGKCFRQNVSTHPVKLEEVKDLSIEVEKRLDERHARQEGYCPIRRAIFSDCFDEILRQVIVEDPVTGVLLGRIRDEAKMTIGCYRRLNQSMDAYGNRKGLQVEATRNKLDCLNSQIEENQASISKELINLRAKHAQIVAEFKRRDAELVRQNEADIKRKLDDLDFFKGISNQLNKKLEEVRANAKEFV